MLEGKESAVNGAQSTQSPYKILSLRKAEDIQESRGMQGNATTVQILERWCQEINTPASFSFYSLINQCL